MSHSATPSQSRRKVVTITEEVPGVPRTERYFIRYRRKVHYFRSAAAAKRWCRDRGQPYTVSPFKP